MKSQHLAHFMQNTLYWLVFKLKGFHIIKLLTCPQNRAGPEHFSALSDLTQLRIMTKIHDDPQNPLN